MSKVQQNINEGDTVTHELVVSESTSGQTLSVRYRLVDGAGTGTELASVSGASANTAITFSGDWSAVAVGDYNLEVWQDFGGASQKPIYPDAQVTEHIITIVSRFGI